MSISTYQEICNKVKNTEDKSRYDELLTLVNREINSIDKVPITVFDEIQIHIHSPLSYKLTKADIKKLRKELKLSGWNCRYKMFGNGMYAEIKILYIFPNGNFITNFLGLLFS